MKIVVIGAGIIGISSAYCIKNAFQNVDVTVCAETFTPNTTSDGAAGYLIPHDDNGTPREVAKNWHVSTLQYANKLIVDNDLSAQIGLSTVHTYMLFKEKQTDLPDWHDVVYNCHLLKPDELNRFPVDVMSGYSFSTVCLESSKYIPWLTKLFENLGGKLLQRKVSTLEELAEDFDLIVNCAGLGAKNLVNDDTINPIRGQVVRLKAPWVKEGYCYVGSSEVTMILPNQENVLIGSTFDVGNAMLEIDEKIREEMLKNARNILPSLKHAEFLCDWVGLRPGRKGVRLETENIPLQSLNNKTTLTVIHNYGHSASGITFHWGCANEVLTLVKQWMEKMTE